MILTNAFRNLLECNKEAVALLRDSVAQSTFSNTTTDGLKAEVAKHEKEEQLEQIMFAVVGAMEVGNCKHHSTM